MARFALSLMPDQVQVNVKHFLPTFFADVELELVARELFLLGELFCGDEEMAEKWLLLLGSIGYGCDVFTRNDQKVRGILWMNIGEGDAFVVLMEER